MDSGAESETSGSGPQFGFKPENSVSNLKCRVRNWIPVPCLRFRTPNLKPNRNFETEYSDPNRNPNLDSETEFASRRAVRPVMVGPVLQRTPDGIDRGASAKSNGYLRGGERGVSRQEAPLPQAQRRDLEIPDGRRVHEARSGQMSARRHQDGQARIQGSSTGP